MDGGFKHLKVSGDKSDVVVKPNSVAYGPKGIKHACIAKGIAQAVQSIEHDNGPFIAPLESVDHGVHGRSVRQNIVRSVRRKQGIRLGQWKAVSGFGLSVGQTKQAEQRHASLSQLNAELNHWMRIRRIKEVDPAGFEGRCRMGINRG